MMQRTILYSLLGCVLVGVGPAAWAQAPADTETKIGSILRTAPPAITQVATIVDWPARPGAELPVLRHGSDVWTCITDNPATAEPDAMCMDPSGLAWVRAYLTQQEPRITRLGIIYVLQGGAPMSNTDPHATGPTADNEWMDPVVPHLGLVLPDAKALEGLPTDPHHGGPWVMFRGTPYAHVMVPVPSYPSDD